MEEDGDFTIHFQNINSEVVESIVCYDCSLPSFELLLFLSWRKDGKHAPIWSCSLIVGRAMSMGSTIFFSFPMLAHFLARAITQKVSFRILFTQHFNSTHLNHYIYYEIQRRVWWSHGLYF